MPINDPNALPETCFADSGGVSIAYQVMGEGPVNLVMVPGVVSHVEFMHEFADHTKFMRRLARFSRIAAFDKRGQGMSDRVSGAPTLDQRSDDVRAVMDTLKMDRAAIFAVSEGSMMSAYFAAAHPDRVSHLIIYGGTPKIMKGDDWPIGISPETREAFFGNWGDGHFITDWVAPSWKWDPPAAAIARRFERLSCSPGNLLSFVKQLSELDVRSILPQIRVPTLVLHRKTDMVVPVAMGRYYADYIPGARLIEYETGDHAPSALGWREMCSDIEEFVTGERNDAPLFADRVLATVMFTDIVDSTSRSAKIGDRAWREKLDEHDRIARRLVEQQRGRFIKSTGDGVLATFDGPGRAIRCALAMEPSLAKLDLSVRAGLHTGEIEERGDDIGGIAVHVAARVMAHASAGEVMVSRVVADLVAGSGISFADRGETALKGVPGNWRLLSASL